MLLLPFDKRTVLCTEATVTQSTVDVVLDKIPFLLPSDEAVQLTISRVAGQGRIMRRINKTGL